MSDTDEPEFSRASAHGSNMESGNSAPGNANSALGKTEHLPLIVWTPYQEDPWSRKMILSLDGGGIRGYSSLLILKRLMYLIELIEHGLLDRETSKENTSYCPNRSSEDYPWNPDHVISNFSEGRPRAESNNEDIAASVETTFGGWESRNFKPHHYFDYMAGTSTGGLSAIMLGRMEQTVDQALLHYNIVGGQVFSRPRFLPTHIHQSMAIFRPKYATRHMEKALKHVIKESLREELKRNKSTGDIAPLRSDQRRCRTLVISHGGAPHALREYVFRSYDHDHPDPQAPPFRNWMYRNPGPAHQDPIWFAGRATSAAPGYFRAVKSLPSHSHKRRFIDGAIVANNPSRVTWNEVCQRHSTKPLVFLSIGTGAPADRPAEQEEQPNQGISRAWKDWLDVGKILVKLATSSENTHFEMANITNDPNLINDPRSKTSYYRLNVTPSDNGESLKDILLDEWTPKSNEPRTRDRIFKHAGSRGQPSSDAEQGCRSGSTTKKRILDLTKSYLKQDDVQQELVHCAWQLVDVRRKRAQTDRWEQYACLYAYYCPEDDCKLRMGTRQFDCREKLRRHGMDVHYMIINTDETQNTCAQGNCFYNGLRAHDDRNEYLHHLRDSHGITHPYFLNREQFEKWLNRGRRTLEKIHEEQQKATNTFTPYRSNTGEVNHVGNMRIC